MITKIENEHGLCVDNKNHVTCAYYNRGARCIKPDYETCLDMVTGKSYIFIDDGINEVNNVSNPR